MLRLDFSRAELSLPQTARKTQRASISGVQDKVQLKHVRGRFDVVESGGDYILKPVPLNTAARLPEDIPVNESLTMDIASSVFGIKTAEHSLVALSDGSYAYMTRRFDFRNGIKIRQEDFCQLSGRSEETHGDNYKYDSSYEELADLVRTHCPAAAVENPRVFEVILFNYVFSNGDAHLKNFSMHESSHGDFILTPFYDLLNTALHFPNEPSATGLEFFADGHFTSRYEDLGFYSSADFVELGRHFGVGERDVMAAIERFASNADRVRAEVGASLLSEAAKADYLLRFADRLKAIGQ